MPDNRDYITSDGQGGSIGISEDVVASISSLAAAEVEGLAGFVAPGVDFNELLGKKNLAKGVRVQLDGDQVMVDLFVRVRYGIKIPAFAAQIQQAVSSAVTEMAGLKVVAVNVRVVGLELPKREVKQSRDE